MKIQTRLPVSSMLICAGFAASTLAGPVLGLPFTFSTGEVTDAMASATQPDTSGAFEIESADDFLLGSSDTDR